ncbi:Sec-independent protein translocase subunit TatA/TatB [Microbacterium marinilacus]|uniref:Sec-independent protein translocase TatB n=1 Tax=Microbacterium marinilacus TaxID=415209 RepID=A0ABP7BTA7_9MICO|nr:Sec-independent protein translocase TatB [Microbacterium marinilacus]MBY0689205.1 Sec-independent protein translocase TatB [Microbacterium marinilacus]
MLGLTVEKLFVVAILAAVIIGPARLPAYAQRLGEFARAVRSFTETARARAESEAGLPLSAEEWRELDPRRYDPRRIIQEALAQERGGAVPPASAADATDPGRPEAGSPSDPAPPSADPAPPAAEPAPRYIIGGTSAHPRRILVPAAPATPSPTPGPDAQAQDAALSS